MVAACGGDPSPASDGPPGDPDAPGDGGSDGDAPPDGPGPTGSRVWVVGDMLENTRTQAVSFLDGATLPIAPAAIPASGEVFDFGDALASVPFDANGGKVAYVADATVAGRFDLYVAGATGDAPVLVVTGGVAGVEILAVALSPDGSKVAFVRDSAALNGGYDAYVVAAVAGATAVQVSPARPGGAATPAQLRVANTLTWSPDSRYLAFSGDLVENGFEQAYAVDTSVASPVAVELIARADVASPGVRGAVQFDHAGNLYFRARTTPSRHQLFRATPAGGRVALAVPMRGDGQTPDVGPFVISRDGTQVVIAIDAPTAQRFDLYATPLASFAPVKITALAANGAPNATLPLWFSPDGTRVALVADYLTAGVFNEPFVVHLDGSTPIPRRLVAVESSCAGCTTPNTSMMQWTTDGTAVYVAGDLATDNDVELFRVDPGAEDQAPVLAVDVATGGDVLAVIVRPE